MVFALAGLVTRNRLFAELGTFLGHNIALENAGRWKLVSDNQQQNLPNV